MSKKRRLQCNLCTLYRIEVMKSCSIFFLFKATLFKLYSKDLSFFSSFMEIQIQIKTEYWFTMSGSDSGMQSRPESQDLSGLERWYTNRSLVPFFSNKFSLAGLFHQSEQISTSQQQSLHIVLVPIIPVSPSLWRSVSDPFPAAGWAAPSWVWRVNIQGSWPDPRPSWGQT